MSNPLARVWRRLVEGSWAHNLANRVGVPSGRRQQLRLDMQRAWLAAQMWRLAQQSSAANPIPVNAYQRLLLDSRIMPKEETFPYVAEHLRQQILGVAADLHAALEEAGDAMPAARAMMQAEASMTGRAVPFDSVAGKPVLSRQRVSELLQQRCGYSLQIKHSTVDHPDAGLGLFVQGDAPVGAVIAMTPGIMYSRTQLTHMPNYPKVALNNPYLSSTIEMNVFDSKPWGGKDSPITSGSNRQQSASPSSGSTSDSASSSSSADKTESVSQASPNAWLLDALEERHPLAWAHIANHPGPGMQPNVLEVPFDLDLSPQPETAQHSQTQAESNGRHQQGTESTSSSELTQPCWLRVYVPCAPFIQPPSHEELSQGDHRQAAAEALLASCGWPSVQGTADSTEEEEEQVGFRLPGLPAAGSSSSRTRAHKGKPVQGMALIATQALRDGDEVLLNYRLSPHAARPPWYHSIDPEAEARRWAQMPFRSLLS